MIKCPLLGPVRSGPGHKQFLILILQWLQPQIGSPEPYLRRQEVRGSAERPLEHRGPLGI